MGDSFISGEGAEFVNGTHTGPYAAVRDAGGRMQGFQDYSADNSNAYFCHRSDKAEVAVAQLSGISARFNIACSGAIPRDIGQPSYTREHGRYVAAQLDQLRAIATTHDIDLVVINLGANSLGFGDVAAKCIGKFLTDAFTGWWEPWINIWSPHATTTGACGAGDFPDAADIARAEADLAAASRLILHTLDQIDADGQHRVVFQDYVNPLPEDFDVKFHTEDGRSDTRDKFRSLARERYAAGCPVHRGTLRHAHDMSENLGAMISRVHDGMLREFPGSDLVYLDVQQAFDGARLCETTGSPVGALHSPTRAITNSTGRVQQTLDGDKLDVRDLFENCTDYFQRCQEAWHPNSNGHAVLGRCLTAAWTATAPLVDCRRLGDGRIVTDQKLPSVDVSLSGRVQQSLDRTGMPILAVSASYSAKLQNAPGLSITGVRVTATSVNNGSLPAKTSMSGTYSYDVRCSATQINLRVSVRVTLSDGSVASGGSTFSRNVSDCGGSDIPIR